MNFPTIYGKRTIVLAGAHVALRQYGRSLKRPAAMPQARRVKPRGRIRAWINNSK